MIAGWSPGIGDPTVFGWLTVFNYCLGSYLCYGAARMDWRNKGVWTVLGICFLFLAINKQLDLQSLLTSVGREAAKIGGWYDDRRIFQRNFVITVSSVGAILVFGMLYIVRGRAAHVRFALLGASMLVVFLVLRAASFHKFDSILGTAFVGVRVNHVLENLSILMVSTGALLAKRHRRR